MRGVVRTLAIAILVVAHPYEEVAACSSWVLTPTEITAQAEVIIRVRAEAYKPLPTARAFRGLVRFKILETLKGSPAGESIELPGHMAYEGSNDGEPPYQRVRKGGLHGGCYAFDYERSAEFLLFLSHPTPYFPAVALDPNQITPYWAPLAPTNEWVAGPEDPWVIWVREALKPTPREGPQNNQMKLTSAHVRARGTARSDGRARGRMLATRQLRCRSCSPSFMRTCSLSGC